jgi:hypothetical protein
MTTATTEMDLLEVLTQPLAACWTSEDTFRFASESAQRHDPPKA